MRFIRKDKQAPEPHNRRFFAWLPITIGRETRWLEYVTVYCTYFKGGISGKIYYDYVKFIDD